MTVNVFMFYTNQGTCARPENKALEGYAHGTVRNYNQIYLEDRPIESSAWKKCCSHSLLHSSFLLSPHKRVPTLLPTERTGSPSFSNGKEELRESFHLSGYSSAFKRFVKVRF